MSLTLLNFFKYEKVDGFVRVVRDNRVVVCMKYQDSHLGAVIKFDTVVKKINTYKTLFPWAKFRHDLLNTGYTNSPAPGSLYVNWKSAPFIDCRKEYILYFQTIKVKKIISFRRRVK